MRRPRERKVIMREGKETIRVRNRGKQKKTEQQKNKKEEIE